MNDHTSGTDNGEQLYANLRTGHRTDTHRRERAHRRVPAQHSSRANMGPRPYVELMPNNRARVNEGPILNLSLNVDTTVRPASPKPPPTR